MVDISLAVNASFGNLRARTISTSRATALHAAASRLDSILKENNQSLKISVGHWNAVLGSVHGSTSPPEFAFQSSGDCLSSLRRCRLYDFAAAFFRGRIRITGASNA